MARAPPLAIRDEDAGIITPEEERRAILFLYPEIFEEQFL
jgi:hypothetical protein